MFVITPNKNYINWLALLICATIGMTVSLYGYYQIINIPPPTTLNINQFPNTISISSPQMNQTIKNPVEISGKAMANDRKLLFQIKDKEGNLLAETTTPATKTKISPFSVVLSYAPSGTNTGFIEVSACCSLIEEEMSKKIILISFAN